MKKFIHRIQDLGQKAGQLKEAVEGVPGQAARLRDAVLVTAGQLQDMRKDVQASVAGLRAENDDRIAAALNEIQAGTDEIRKAGYELGGVEMELDPVQRLMVLLDKVADVRASELQSLLAANASRRTLHGVLSALVKAEEFAARCGLRELEYRQLRVSVGPIPSIRLIWRAEEIETVVVPPALPASAYPKPPTPVATRPEPAGASAPASLPAPEASPFGKDSFFERRVSEPTVNAENSEVESLAPRPSEELPAPTRREPVAAPDRSDWSSSALDRFKKMPNLSRR
jgi:hypothetical protein